MLTGKFSLRSDSFALGAPVSVYLEYANTGADPIAFMIGNGRKDGFRFLCPDPRVTQLNPYHEFGGLTEVIKLEPGANGAREVRLEQYLEFTAPGRYRIDCELDARLCDDMLNPIATEAIRGTIELRFNVAGT